MASQANRQVLFTLIFVIFLSGICQGMLLPLLSIMLEERGVSAGLNGLNGSAPYLGILVGAPFMERALYRFGFRPLLLTGTLVMTAAVLILPHTFSFWSWMGLRFLIGLASHAFHYGAVVWMILIAPDHKRGRYLSIYGFSVGLGFALGPFLSNLRNISLMLPFGLTAGLTLFSALLVYCLKSVPAAGDDGKPPESSLSKRATQVLALAWFALLPGLGYGIMESAISASYPIFLSRMGLGGARTSLILFVFFTAGLITQLPLGRLSDGLGRRRLLILLTLVGASAFLGSALAPVALYPLVICLALAGGALGSSYSLGLTYVADSIPKSLLPTGNALSSVSFGIGSLMGPFMGGNFIQHLPGLNIGWMLTLVYALILCGLVLGSPARKAGA
ncbi:MAG: MFS transporter [Desulfobacterales bacterium]|nr:MFS transporter [Desulfobacterales bacterium]